MITLYILTIHSNLISYLGLVSFAGSGGGKCNSWKVEGVSLFGWSFKRRENRKNSFYGKILLTFHGKHKLI